MACDTRLAERISCKKVLEKVRALAAERHGDAGTALDAWYRITKKAEWKNLMDARRVFPTADAVGKFVGAGAEEFEEIEVAEDLELLADFVGD